MSDSQPLGERLARVEMDLANHRRESGDHNAAVDRKLDALLKKIDDFTALLNQAKGAKWLLWGIGALLAWLAGIGDWIKHLVK